MRLSKILQPAAVMVVLFAAVVQAADRDDKLHIKAHVVSGTNRFLGQPLFDFGSSFGTAGFSTLRAGFVN